MRLFVGLAIDESVKETLERLTLRLRTRDDGLRWSSREQWHVTLAFLGEVDDAGKARLAAELKQVRMEPLTLRVDQLGVFERAGILQAEVEVTPALLALYEAVSAAARRCGLAVEERPYRAHVTLARAKNRDGRKTIERLRRGTDRQRLSASWRAEDFLLYESQSSPEGSQYVVLERFNLDTENAKS